MHPIVAAAAEGQLPDWANVSNKRAAHIERVRLLLGEWADAAGLPAEDGMRWRATGCLHDALHDAPHDDLRLAVPADFRDAPGKVLHGPACVVRLRNEGVQDEELMHAILYHTLGHEAFGRMGCALFAADYLEPGRQQDPDVRAALRSRMPLEMDTVVPIILKQRLLDQVGNGRRIRMETLAFWNAISDDRRP